MKPQGLMNEVRLLWRFRGFLLESVRREFKSRYLHTQFRWLWVILQPLAMLSVYTLVFSQLMRPGMEQLKTPWAYSIYLCAGLLAWGLFSEILTRSVGLYVSHADLIKKVRLPVLVLPAVITLAGLVNYGIVMALFLFFLFLVGGFPGWVVLAALPVIGLLVGFALGLGLLCGLFNVFYRDVGQGIGILMQFWFWLTPIVYVVHALPARVVGFFELNPIWPFIRALQDIFLLHKPPQWSNLAIPALLMLVFLTLAWRAQLRLGQEIVDEL